MKLRLTWKEFEAYALSVIAKEKAITGEPKYRKVYNYEPEGDHYDFPDYIDIDVASTEL